MYNTCPKCGHVRKPKETASKESCPACGLIFKHYLKSQLRRELGFQKTRSSARTATAPGLWSHGKALFLPTPSTPSEPLVFYASVITYIVFFIWGWQFIFMDYAYYQINTRIDDAVPDIFQSFMHNINLVFHEAGHVLFRLFGYFMAVLGGSLFQVLVPLIVCGVFLFKERKAFAASIALWWAAQSLMDIAPYINDARNGQIILLGGTTGAESEGYHDWETLLGMMDLMTYDHRIADTVDGFAVLLMLLAFIWGAAALRQQYQQKK